MKEPNIYNFNIVIKKINEIIEKLVEKSVITEGEIEKLEE